MLAHGRALVPALKASAGQSHESFKTQHTLLTAARAEPAKGPEHSAVVSLRKELKGRLEKASGLSEDSTQQGQDGV